MLQTAYVFYEALTFDNGFLNNYTIYPILGEPPNWGTIICLWETPGMIGKAGSCCHEKEKGKIDINMLESEKYMTSC